MADNAGINAGEGYIRATALIGFSNLVTSAGGDSLQLLDKAGLPATALHDPDSLISYRRFGVLLEIAARDLDRPSFALEWVLATPDHFPNHGPLALLARFVTTLREYIETGLVYWRIHSTGGQFELIDDQPGEDAIFRSIDDRWLPTRQVVELNLGNVCTIARVVSGFTEERPTLVRFQHHRPVDLSLHEKVFGCPVEFGARSDEIWFKKKYLDYPVNGNLRLLKSMMQSYIRSRIREMPIFDSSMRATVALAISSMGGLNKCSHELVAESLGLSAKKLRRLLAAEGTSFSDILTEVRQRRAKQLLADSSAPVSEIAALLDYSTTVPFSIAFKRWTGLSPIQFRRRTKAE